ncbi:siderophore-interacting protein [Streptomyces sp. BG9H]|uniref:Siderophore-interacting protein n=1 Tax=Streptomyces anatolicus TaxID=2675858 RepID=A0ABS6YP27_9ACTN|nr:siderophore-interacting protein [Streptomyces anatolicus]MBW5423188.1 siderophore-interacting protein [Streptomyces anatolicus]
MTDSPYRYFDVEVLRTEHLTPAMIRVTFGGADLARMASGGRDQRVKIFLPHPGQDAPVMPDTTTGDTADWYAAWCGLDPSVRGIMRTYTTRELRRDPDELVIDFAVHCPRPSPADGPATSWARTARPGARIGVLAPVEEENSAYDFRPPQDTDWLLLTADESALPAVAGILETLPPALPTRVWIEVHDLADRQPLPTKADAEIHWLTREGATTDAIRAADLPEGTPYAWIAGESATVKAIRRHLVNDRAFDRKRVSFSGYWRKNTTTDELIDRGENP